MLPGQIAILIGALVSAAVLLIMGVISFQNSKKERRAAARKKAREEAQAKLAEAQEDAAFEQLDNEPILFAEEPITFEPETEADKEQPPRSTRNDFDFKF